jgi:prepilin-type N-terminal cleavage/methylation domain-containing protein
MRPTSNRELLTVVGRRLREERGMTLVELLVAISILGVVLLVFTSMMASVQDVVVSESKRSQLNTDARLAMQTIDRNVRSGNLLYDPAGEVGNDPYDAAATGYIFRVYTQAKHQPVDDPRCALWLIDDQQQLKYRWWPALDPASATGWRVVATGVVNRDLGEPAFLIGGDGRTITVNFLINADLAREPAATQEFEASLTGRNTALGYPSNVCQTLPADL